MVGIPGRSRGCLTCRQRKIKCDEALPECSQCCRSRRYTCTGSLTGLFISIATSENVSQHLITTEKSRDSLSLSPVPTRFEAPSASPSSNGENELSHGQNIVAADLALDILSQLQLPPRQPSPAKAFEQMFISHFIRSFGNTRNTPPYWLDKLPEFFVSSVSEPVKDSIRAAVMLFYGILTRNISMQTEANRVYTKALHSLRSRLQNETLVREETLSICDHSTSTNAKLSTNNMVICAPIMMCHFEMMSSSSPDGWINHVEAAAKMLEIRGPKDCRLGLKHQTFLTVRLFILFVCMTTNKVHAFMFEPWMTIPFEKRSKNLWDELVDILLLLPKCLISSEQFLQQGRQESSGIGRELRDSVLSLASALSRWRLKYPYAEDSLRPSHLDSDNPVGEYPYDAAMALVTVFDAANVIAFSLLLLVSPSAFHPSHNYNAQLHAQSVLSTDAYLDSNYVTVPGGGSLLMAFALKILSLWAPLQQQRDYAIKKLQSWDPHETPYGRRGFAAPVLMEYDAETKVTNLFHVNVAREILRQRRGSMLLQ